MILMLTPEQRNEIVSALGDCIHTDECAQRLSHSGLVQVAFAEVIGGEFSKSPYQGFFGI